MIDVTHEMQISMNFGKVYIIQCRCGFRPIKKEQIIELHQDKYSVCGGCGKEFKFKMEVFEKEN